MNIFTRIAALCFFYLLLSTSAFSQGNLTPPGGPPAPTMKTLQQIEPRIDLQNAPTAAVTTTNAAYHFIINQPGSYYLSANVGVTKTNGIQINAEGVTLDLNGFEIARASGSGGNGIEIAGTSHRACVRNGSLKGFAYGINSVLLVTTTARGCAFRDLTVSGCTNYGILAGEGAVLEACRAHGNSGEAGIFARSGSTLTNCTAWGNTTRFGFVAEDGSSLANCLAYGNTGDAGIFAGSGSSLTNCSVYSNTVTHGIWALAGSSLANCSAGQNTSSASSSAGIRTGSGCAITHCTASRNTSTAATSTPTTGMGFDVGGNSTIQSCTASLNEGDGINVSADAVVRDNTCDSNGFNGDGAGIHATSSDNRIEGNNVTDNDRGIDVVLAGNFIARNTASGNTTNWDVAAGNVILVLQAATAAAVTGDSGGVSPGSTNPNANYTY